MEVLVSEALDESKAAPVPEPSQARLRRRDLASVHLGYAVLALFTLRLTPDRFLHAIFPDRGDPLLNLYLLEHGSRTLDHLFSGFWSPPFYFPEPMMRTLSDHLIGPVVVFRALRSLGLDGIAAYNFLLFAVFWLTAAATFFVFRRLGLGDRASFLGGALFSYCPYRIDQLSHLQVLWMIALPLVIWAFDELMRAPSPRRAAIFLAWFLVHQTGGMYLAYLIHIPLFAIALLRGRELYVESGRDWRRLGRSRLATLVVTALLAAAISVAVFLPYLSMPADVDRGWSLENIRDFGASVLSLLTVPARLPYHPLASLIEYRYENALFPGLLAIVGIVCFFALALAPGVPGRAPARSRQRAVLMAVGAVLVALGLLLADVVTVRGYEVAIFGRRWFDRYYTDQGVLILLGVLALWLGGASPRRILRRLGDADRLMLLLAILAWALCLPVFWIPVRQLLPGMDGMRVSTRAFAFVALGVAWFAARGFEAVLARLPSIAAQRVLVALSILVLVFEARPVGTWTPVPPPADDEMARYISRTDSVTSLAVFPVYTDAREAERMVAASGHWKPLANGFSGRVTGTFGTWGGHRPVIPDETSLEGLRRLGVSHLIFESEAVNRNSRRRFYAQVEALGLRLVRDFDGRELWAIEEEPAGVERQ